jgi:S1-C subfamily serine protease
MKRLTLGVLALVAILAAACGPEVPPTPTSAPESSRSSTSETVPDIFARFNPVVVNVSRGDLRISGFVYDDAGHIVTHARIAAGEGRIWITFHDQTLAEAALVGSDDYGGTAILRVDAGAFSPIPFADSGALEVGQPMIALSNPYGYAGSAAAGTITALRRALPSDIIRAPTGFAYTYPAMIQTDHTLQETALGGPIIDMQGHTAGMIAGIHPEMHGIALSLPADALRHIADRIIAEGQVAYGWLGISTNDNAPVAAVANTLRLPVNYGVLVTDVWADSPAERAGLQGATSSAEIKGRVVRTGGDLIVAVNGESVADMDALLTYLAKNAAPGDTVTLTILRGAKTIGLDITLAERP